VIKGLRHDVFSHYMRCPAYLDSQQFGLCCRNDKKHSSWWRPAGLATALGDCP